MELLKQRMEYIKEDKKVIFIIEKEDKEVARYTYDGVKDSSEIIGELKKIYGFSETEEDNNKYNGILQAFKWLSINVIEQNS